MMKMEHEVSVVIPVYNARHFISRTFEALERQTFRDFEVVAVDDGSTDGSYEFLRGLKTPFPLRVFTQENSGPARARNVGAKNACGSIIVFTDSDCVPKEDWLDGMVRPFADGSVAGVQGTYETLNRDKLVARYVGYEIAYRHERMKSLGEIDFIGTFSAAYRRKVFLDNGGFDTSFKDANAEDPELSYRIKGKGHRLVFNPKAIVLHPHPAGLRRYLRQQFWRGYWRVPMYKKHKDKITGDAYSGRELFFQGIFTGVFLLSFLTLSPIYVLAAAALLLFSNLPFGLFCLKKERKFLYLAPAIASMRSVSGLLGFLLGFFRFNLKS